MRRVRTLSIVAAGLMAVAAVAAAAWRPTAQLAASRPAVNLDTMFPRQFGDWRLDERGPVQLVPPDQAALLQTIYSQILSRTYVGPAGERIMLSVAYGGDQSDATRAHRPEVCYPAQGFEILANTLGSIALDGRVLTVRQLVTKQGPRVEPVTYWIVVGESVASSGPQQKFEQLRYTVRGIVPDGMLVRVSNIDADSARAFRVHEHFVSDLSRALSSETSAHVFGARSGPKGT